MDIEETTKRMHSGKLYYCNNEELSKVQFECLDRLFEYNSLRPSEQEKKQELLKQMFAEIGENCYIETPLNANWGGKFVHIGNNFYANFNLTMVDDTEIYIGDNVLIGPNVTICTAGHPVNPPLRFKQAQFNLPIHIGTNVWIGSNAVILPGISIGDNSVIGAGSIVTKDIPSNVVAVGNPCKVLREISEKDMAYYHKDMKTDIE